jgi:hypothetical protein
MSSANVRPSEPIRPPPPSSVPLAGPGLRAASQADAPVPSPVAALQALIADDLAEPVGRRRFDPVVPLLWAFCVGSWWGAITLVNALMHAYRGG